MRFRIIFLCVASILPALAQVAPSTTLTGTVADASGAMIPSASLDLTNTATRWSRKTTTDPQGRFVFTNVPPGAYTLEASADGFASVRQQNLRLDADVPATLRFTLSVAAAATA